MDGACYLALVPFGEFVLERRFSKRKVASYNRIFASFGGRMSLSLLIPATYKMKDTGMTSWDSAGADLADNENCPSIFWVLKQPAFVTRESGRELGYSSHLIQTWHLSLLLGMAST